MKVWVASMSCCRSGKVFAVSSWAHGRLGLADMEDLAVALSGSLWVKKGGEKSAVWLLVADVLIWSDRQAPGELIQKM